MSKCYKLVPLAVVLSMFLFFVYAELQGNLFLANSVELMLKFELILG